MGWIKNVIIDLIVTGLVVLTVTGGWPPVRWIVLAYTPLMLLLKGVAASSRGLANLSGQQKPGTEPPRWLFHLLYGLNTLLLAAYVLRGADPPLLWGGVAAGWLLIWILSVVADRNRTIRPRDARP